MLIGRSNRRAVVQDLLKYSENTYISEKINLQHAYSYFLGVAWVFDFTLHSPVFDAFSCNTVSVLAIITQLSPELYATVFIVFNSCSVTGHHQNSSFAP
jgi:hypothetical protein